MNTFVCFKKWLPWLVFFVLGLIAPQAALRGQSDAPGQANALNPRGLIHIPIGIANTLDTLKTFVEAEGNFSPGLGSCGIYFWAWDPAAQRLVAPTMPDVRCEHGLGGRGYLIPWSAWQVGTGGVQVRTEVCHVQRDSPDGKVHIVGARARLTNPSGEPRQVSLYVALRSLGPAGWPIRQLAVSEDGKALLAHGRAALVSNSEPAASGVAASDTVGPLAMQGKTPGERAAVSASGDCSGAMRFDLTLGPGRTETLGFICPVLPGRRAVGHQWDRTSTWAQLDLARFNPEDGGALQPDPGPAYYGALRADTLFDEAAQYWKDLVGRATVQTPDPRWGECLAAIVGHAALEMNEGAPDVAVVNYNVFNRDGVYVANILHKAGHPELAALAIDYFLRHPFNGRVQCEADNPGQVLWIMGEHWRFTRDRQWLERVLPSAMKLAAMIRYYRTARPPHYVKATSLDFGDALPPDRPDEKPADRRQVLRPGSCDGHHPEYTEAFDIAGLRAAGVLAEAAGRGVEAARCETLAAALFESYDRQFGARLAKAYGSYSVLWPCRLYGMEAGSAFEQFRGVGAQRPSGWRYFPLATAHQGLLAGNREAGYATVAVHLDHSQMRAWYAFDEGGASGPGAWRSLRTTWKPAAAMPHGWAIAEMWLLVRDCLLFEDGDRLVLLAGIDPQWFTGRQPVVVEALPTHFGPCTLRYVPGAHGAVLHLAGPAAPAGGFVLRLPKTLSATISVDGKPLTRKPSGDVPIPLGTRQAEIRFDGVR